MKLVINIESDNEGVLGNTEVAALVRKVADKIASGAFEGGKIKDYNGNTVGSWEYNSDDSDDESEHPDECPVCGGDRIEHLGTMGARQHYKCKSCGTEFSPND